MHPPGDVGVTKFLLRFFPSVYIWSHADLGEMVGSHYSECARLSAGKTGLTGPFRTSTAIATLYSIFGINMGAIVVMCGHGETCRNVRNTMLSWSSGVMTRWKLRVRTEVETGAASETMLVDRVS
jgi:hypothetical protein